jgi:hypothetical protein
VVLALLCVAIGSTLTHRNEATNLAHGGHTAIRIHPRPLPSVQTPVVAVPVVPVPVVQATADAVVVLPAGPSVAVVPPTENTLIESRHHGRGARSVAGRGTRPGTGHATNTAPGNSAPPSSGELRPSGI